MIITDIFAGKELRFAPVKLRVLRERQAVINSFLTGKPASFDAFIDLMEVIYASLQPEQPDLPHEEIDNLFDLYTCVAGFQCAMRASGFIFQPLPEGEEKPGAVN